MTRYVIDASIAVEYLLKTPLGLNVTEVIEAESHVAPELFDAEVLSALRKLVLRGHLEEDRARVAITDLKDWHLHRIAHRSLVQMAWEHRRNVSAYDAFYVAVARLHNLPILTTDGRLSRATGLGVVVQNVQIA